MQNNNDQKKRIKAKNSLNFLREHPALGVDIFGDSLFDGAWFHMAKCCKRGKDESSKRHLKIYRGNKGWEKFKNRFEEEYKDDKEFPKKLQSVDATYQEIYGEKWIFDHVEYWYETTFFVYEGDPYSRKECSDYKNWVRYGGIEGGANTFEDSLISCANNIKKALGNFTNKDIFLTQEEVINHKEEEIFLGKEDLNFTVNPNYLEVTNGMTNLRWLRWFIETDYCKKNWDFEINTFKSKIKLLVDKLPKKRKNIIHKIRVKNGITGPLDPLRPF